MYGANVKKIREKKKITQEGLAKRIGVSRQAVCMWETNKRELKAATINKIAHILCVLPNQILREEAALNGKGGIMKGTIMSSIKKKGKEDCVMKKTQCKAAFTLTAPKASRVCVTGSFNSWDKTGELLKKDKSGVWATDLNLKPGRYEYKYIVDGQWWTDPLNKSTVRNSFGSENSVLEIKG